MDNNKEELENIKQSEVLSDTVRLLSILKNANSTGLSYYKFWRAVRISTFREEMRFARALKYLLEEDKIIEIRPFTYKVRPKRRILDAFFRRSE